MNKRWFIWLVAKQDGSSQWYGPRYQTDREAHDESWALMKSRGVKWPYRLIWTGIRYEFDERPLSHLLVNSQRRYV